MSYPDLTVADTNYVALTVADTNYVALTVADTNYVALTVYCAAKISWPRFNTLIAPITIIRQYIEQQKTPD